MRDTKKLFSYVAVAIGLVLAFQNCAPTHLAQESSQENRRAAIAVEMKKTLGENETQGFQNVHRLILLPDDQIEIEVACGPARQARLRNFDSDKSLLEVTHEVAVGIDQIRTKTDPDQVHVLGCASEAMNETVELLEQLVRVNRARREASRLHFKTTDGLVLTFQLID